MRNKLSETVQKKGVCLGLAVFLCVSNLLLSAGIVTGCGKAEVDPERPVVTEDNTLVVYTSHKAEVYEPIIQEFEDQTGIYVTVKDGGTREILGAISDGAYCDVVFGGGAESYEVYEEYFTPYRPAGANGLNPDYVCEENLWTPFTALPLVFIYNSHVLREEEAPHSWKELMQEEWKGEIAFADPNKSGTSCMILCGMMQVLGMDEEELIPALLEQLDGNILSGSSDVWAAVNGGSQYVGVTLESAAMTQIAQGSSIGIIHPSDGPCVIPDGCAIVKNAAHPENAKKFEDFIAGKAVQKYVIGHLHRRTVRKDLNAAAITDELPMIRPLSFDIEEAAAAEPSILDVWNARTGKEGEK